MPFANYGDAQPVLIDRVGRYCSYCEMRLDNVPAVEHISPKSKDSARERDWNNFLLACAYCNAYKRDDPKPSLLPEYCWPDRDNTFRAYRYTQSGEVEINRALTDAQQALAMRLRALVRLNARPHEGLPFEAGDPRWRKRISIWEIATEQREELSTRDTPRMRSLIVKTACETGCWSVWMTVFDGDPEMRQRLIDGFKGTARACFDAHAAPVARPGGAL